MLTILINDHNTNKNKQHNQINIRLITGATLSTLLLIISINYIQLIIPYLLCLTE